MTTPQTQLSSEDLYCSEYFVSQGQDRKKGDIIVCNLSQQKQSIIRFDKVQDRHCRLTGCLSHLFPLIDRLLDTYSKQYPQFIILINIHFIAIPYPDHFILQF